MDISVTEFKHRCLEIIRRVKKTGTAVTLTRRVRVGASAAALSGMSTSNLQPWEQLRAMGGRLRAEPGPGAGALGGALAASAGSS